MNTPIVDFVKAYAEKNPLRAHMPGHKGVGFLGAEKYDITEVDGADALYHGNGIITQSQNNAKALFNSAKTVYSCEGSSLSIRAMIYLAMLCAMQQNKPFRLLACRNAHRSFMTALGLLDAVVEWLYSDKENGIISCEITPEQLENALSNMAQKPTAFYVTSPDYLGNIADIKGLSRVCKKYGILLLVDNAHGSYLSFLEENMHPMCLGADMCCDSAHKTLPVLTGGAYLHIGKNAPEILSDNAERAMLLFASTSPSYLILQSLDYANKYILDGYKEILDKFCKNVQSLKERLSQGGFSIIGNEPLKLTVAPKSYGYSGEELAEILRDNNIECEYSDRDYTVLMLTPEIEEKELVRLEKTLLSIEKREAKTEKIPSVPKPKKAMSVRQALMSVQQRANVSECIGRVLSDAVVSCPPAIPVIVAGEIIDEDVVACLEYYGIEKCNVICN